MPEALPDPAPTRAALLAWYDGAKRDLPWRATRDPYAIFVSELMLQQTRVETVVPYFERFVRRFPGFADLAAANVDDVLTAWAGLGYYRRARNMHLCAREVVARHHGAFPRTRVEAEALPGVGPYTAGAVLSIAYGAPEPLVDGNVARVFSRLLALDAELGTPASRDALWGAAAALVPGERPGDLNQALMELGATVCTPRSPRCDACPLATRCAAHAQGRVEELPRMPKKRAVPEIACTAIVARDGARVLLGKRPPTGLFAGLWEPPLGEGDPAFVVDAFARCGIALEDAGVVSRVTHVLTHRRMAIDVVAARLRAVSKQVLPKQVPGYERVALVDIDASHDHALSTLARKVMAAGDVPTKAPEKAPNAPRSRRKAR